MTESIIGWQAPAQWLCLWLCIDSAEMLTLLRASGGKKKCSENTGQHILPPNTI